MTEGSGALRGVPAEWVVSNSASEVRARERLLPFQASKEIPPKKCR